MRRSALLSVSFLSVKTNINTFILFNLHFVYIVESSAYLAATPGKLGEARSLILAIVPTRVCEKVGEYV